jgi:hypothetical protein
VRLSLSRRPYLKRRCQGGSTSRLSECIFSRRSPWPDNSTVTRLRDEGETEDDTLTKTKLVTYFHEYTPPFDVRPLMSRMLRSVPSEYLVGLDSVVFTSTDTFSRKRRRSKTRSRRRTRKDSEDSWPLSPCSGRRDCLDRDICRSDFRGMGARIVVEAASSARFPACTCTVSRDRTPHPHYDST